MRIAYLSNRFPSPVEPYVVDEIREFRKRGIDVVVCSVLRPLATTADDHDLSGKDVLYLLPPAPWLSVRATWLWIRQFWRLRDLWGDILSGHEPASRKLKTIPHTWLGAYLALLLHGHGIEHIHVHHGYFASWVAMVAARLLGIRFSMTLHGSDLLLHEAYLNLKLAQCAFCVTISQFNRKYILNRYPHLAPGKILVQRMGVDCVRSVADPIPPCQPRSFLNLLAVGRLHPVKDHAFLVCACRLLKDRGGRFACTLAGDGPERNRLQQLIHHLDLKAEVHILGHVQHEHLGALYRQADLVVLTSQSEGIPLVLMEAMSFAKPVLAPAITGIPELVADGKNGFLYRAGSLTDFVERVEMIRDAYSGLGPLCHAARQQVIENFNREKNLAAFCDVFLAQLGQSEETQRCEHPLLQQV